MLLIHRDVGEVVGVDEDVGLRLEVIEAATEEPVVLVGVGIQVTTGAVGVEGGEFAMSSDL